MKMSKTPNQDIYLQDLKRITKIINFNLPVAESYYDIIYING